MSIEDDIKEIERLKKEIKLLEEKVAGKNLAEKKLNEAALLLYKFREILASMPRDHEVTRMFDNLANCFGFEYAGAAGDSPDYWKSLDVESGGEPDLSYEFPEVLKHIEEYKYKKNEVM